MGRQAFQQFQSAVWQPSSVEAQQWVRIMQSLLQCRQQLSAWGEQFIRAALLPDIGTITEAADALADLEINLKRLIVWLDSQSLVHWIKLQECLKTTISNYEVAATGGYLTTYLNWRNRHDKHLLSAREQGEFENLRFLVGRNIMVFADDIQSSLDIAISERRRYR